MKNKSILSLLLLTLASLAIARPQQISDVDEKDMEEITPPKDQPDNSAPTAQDIKEDSELENELEELIEDEEDEDYYDDYGWGESIMNPIRNVGQSISNGVNVAAGAVNAGVDMANSWWVGSGDDDYDDYFENYDDANEQVNAWWDAHVDQEYNYDEDDGELEGKDILPKSAQQSDMEDDEDDYIDEDDYDYYDLYAAMRYPKPEESKIEAKQIHHPKDNKVVLNRMRSRADIPYGVDDYFDFVVIAMCVILLFIMMLAGISRYNNQRYLKRTYGKKNDENRPLIH